MNNRPNIELALRQMATPDPERPLPPPGLIWWRAEIERVRRSRARSARPVALVYAASCLAAGGVGMSAGGPAILQWLAIPASLASAVVVWKLYSTAPQRRQH